MSDISTKIETTIGKLLDAIDRAVDQQSADRAKLYAEAVGALSPLSFGFGRMPAGLESGAAIEQGSSSD